jgi:hypothetical protein
MQPLHWQPLVVLLLIGLGTVWWLRRSQIVVGEVPVRLDDLPRVFRLLEAAATNGAYASLCFGSNGEAPAQNDPLTVQFSFERMHLGLDWPLLSSLNVEAESRVSAFLSAHGCSPQRLEWEAGPYLRVEDGDLVALCQQLLTELFGVTRTQKIYLTAEGFEWPA